MMKKKTTQEMAAVMMTYQPGQKWQQRRWELTDWRNCISRGHDWNWSVYDYRQKPERKFRPWKLEDVPLGAWYIHESGGMPLFADRIYPDGLKFAGNAEIFPYAQLAAQFRYSIDNMVTIKPCGVLEEAP